MPSSPVELIGFVVVVALVILSYLTIRFFRRKRRIAHLTEKSRMLFERGAKERKIPPGQFTLLQAMLDHVQIAPYEWHRIFADESLFRKLARDYLAHYPEAAKEMSALRVFTGFPPRKPEEPVFLSAELMPSETVFSTQSGYRPLVIRKITTSGVVVEDPEPRSKNEPPGGLLPELYQDFTIVRKESIYRFHTTVADRRGRFFLLRHAGLEKDEKRADFRAPVALSAMLDQNRMQTRNLSGSGALFSYTGEIVLPQTALPDREQAESKSLMKLNCVLFLPDQAKIHCFARIVAHDSSEKLIRCTFTDIRDSDRDRIYRLLLQKQRIERNESKLVSDNQATASYG